MNEGKTDPGIRAIIADDEMLSIDLIKVLLEKWPQIEIIAECGNGLAALNSILELKPGLVFLDVQMPDMNGFEMLKELEETNMPYIIFVSAHDKYAIKAFEASAIDYLLKPVSRQRFDKSITKVLQTIKDKQIDHKIFAQLLADYSKKEQPIAESRFLSRILLREGKKLFFVKTPEIDWIEASGDYVKIHAKGKSSLLSFSMGDLDKKLNPNQFIRVHRSAIVNIDFIKELHSHTNGEFNLVLKNEMIVRLSRSFKDRLKPYMDKTS